MAIKSIKDIRVGDVVAADVFTSSRTLLCRKGTSLTAETIANLHKHAILTIRTQDDGEPSRGAALNDAERESLRREVARRFEGVETTTLAKSVQDAVCRSLEARPLRSSMPPPSTRGSDPPTSSKSSERFDVGTLIERIEVIPTLSAVHEKISALLASPNAGAADVAKVIEEDQGLTVRVLRLARSSLLARNAPVTTVSQAIVKLGMRDVNAIVLRSSLLGAFGRFAAPTHEHLWRHAFASGVAARYLAAKAKTGDPEEAFTMGLVHDMGQLVLLTHFKEAYSALLASLDAPSARLAAAEREAYGVDHCQVGYMMARRWRLPELLVSVVRHHHEPEAASKEYFSTVAVVSIADMLVGALGLGSDGASRVDWPAAKCWEAANPTAQDVENVCLDTLAEYAEFEDFYATTLRPQPSKGPASKRPA